MESGIDRKPSILILTSFLSNDNSSKMIMDISKSLNDDYDIDVLSKYPYNGNKNLNFYSAYNDHEKIIHDFVNWGIVKLSSYKNFFRKANKKDSLPYFFFGLNEEKPPVKTRRIVDKIQKEYDFFLVFFWQGMITSKTLEDIYAKTHKPILLVAADMFPMTGGCSYFWDCNRLKESCGNCPGIFSTNENDITRTNFLFKQKVFREIKCIFLGNSWQCNHASKSKLFNKMGRIYPIVDENVFIPRDKIILKEKFNYSNKKILFFGALGVHDVRKGFKYLIEALQLLSKNRNDLVKDIILVVAGKGDKIIGLEDYRVEYTGHLTFNQLAEYYALSDLFLSPSIQDAGPMMLNQALMCGTPAVAFEIGVACDVINEKTGYLAKYRDSTDFCKGIIDFLTKTESDLEIITETCRIESLARSSYKAFKNDIINAFNLVK